VARGGARRAALSRRRTDPCPDRRTAFLHRYSRDLSRHGQPLKARRAVSSLCCGADVAVAALTDSRHQGQLYELTGPKAITFAEAISEISIATGRVIQFESVSSEAYSAELRAAQLPPEAIDLVMYLFTTVLDGRNTPVADGVQRALGREPTSFKSYVRKTVTTGVWEVS
jgi:hypothetical protein